MTMQTRETTPSNQSIEAWLVAWIAKELGMPADAIETSQSLLEYSLSSVTATMLVGDLEDWLGLTLAPTLVWDYPSIDALVGHLAEKVNGATPATANGLNSSGGTPPITDRLPVAATNAQQLLSGLDQLSDQEVSALLNQLIADEHTANIPSSSS